MSKSKGQFQKGDVVFLKSDVEGNFPMTIIASFPGDDDEYLHYQVTWFTKSGISKSHGFPPSTLRKSEIIKK